MMPKIKSTMYKFNSFIDLTDINDSMELESGQTVAKLEKGGYVATLEVRGEVDVDYRGVNYSTIEQMPQELKDYFHKKDWFVEQVVNGSEVSVIDNNWFEIFLYKKHGKELVWEGIAEVIDAEGMRPIEVEGMLEEVIDTCTPEPK